MERSQKIKLLIQISLFRACKVTALTRPQIYKRHQTKNSSNFVGNYVNLVHYTNLEDGSSFLSAVKNSYHKDYDSLQTELHILLKLRGSPTIVTCLGDSLQQGLSNHGNKVHKLQLEYASEGSLIAFMDRYVDRKSQEPLIKHLMHMILEGLVSIHDHGYVHCNIKPDNLLELKISDFGNSLEVGEVPKFWESEYPWVGTPIGIRGGLRGTILQAPSVCVSKGRISPVCIGGEGGAALILAPQGGGGFRSIIRVSVIGVPIIGIRFIAPTPFNTLVNYKGSCN
ncbi:hypothetical protein HID58_028634 [Brassica napus]|uniref:Protein kinase domain-containing protein n=1 Tax=Brassica napus TaxID=3708 RepID=A0ABQ8CAW1_BRANA|nr:hypothetical protein HID58_028634 [Brassica napus]